MTKVAQLIKGGFSYRAKKEVGYPHNVWQPGFHEHRIRDFNEYCAYKKYVVFNPVKRGLSSDPVDFRYGSASGMYELDRLPQRLNRSLSGGLATPR
jgi:putative transposase